MFLLLSEDRFEEKEEAETGKSLLESNTNQTTYLSVSHDLLSVRLFISYRVCSFLLHLFQGYVKLVGGSHKMSTFTLNNHFPQSKNHRLLSHWTLGKRRRVDR